MFLTLSAFKKEKYIHVYSTRIVVDTPAVFSLFCFFAPCVCHVSGPPSAKDCGASSRLAAILSVVRFSGD